eukprot:908618-Pelagomonas_calceolata.AAC.2
MNAKHHPSEHGVLHGHYEMNAFGTYAAVHCSSNVENLSGPTTLKPLTQSLSTIYQTATNVVRYLF